MDEAINPITGEINWDCPCMGNNNKGPCAELFKKAFRCFVENRDNLDKCQNKFIKMQECQVKYPSLYDNETENN